MDTTPFGAWTSPVSVDMITAGSVGLGGGTIDGDLVYWTESRASEGGRTSLWCRPLAGGEAKELTPDHYVRDMVHEYGGAAWAVRDGVVVFSDFPSHRCYAIVDGETRPLTPEGGKLRYADFQLFPEQNLVIAVREDHRESDINCANELVALDLDSDNADGGTVIATGADFYSSPRLSADGRLAWIEWDHPNMPWDATRLLVGRLADKRVSEQRQVAGTPTTAPCYPAWSGDTLLFLDDPSGFWNFYRLSGDAVERVNTDDHDYCYPAWTFGSAYKVLGDGRIVCTPVVDGEMRGAVMSPDGSLERLATDACTIGGIGGTDAVLLLAQGYVDRPSELVLYTLADGTTEVLRRSMDVELDKGVVSVAEAVSWEGPQGTVHAWYYPPTNPDHRAPDGDRPPLKVLSHGGPTGMSANAFNLAKQYWTSRGWAILDVNYGGSAGYGRAYRERLQGTWGVVDVRDCSDGALAMVEQGRADRKQLAIEGGSAGGYTTLAALTSVDTFTAGNCLFGIADLAVMTRDTHKFESQYLFGLVGGTPDNTALYEERSPIFHLDKLSCALLIQQGRDDRIVPPNQAELMADAVRAKGLPVALIMFDGEGHGFRKAESIKTSIEAANSFFGQVFGYEAAGVEKIEIENL